MDQVRNPRLNKGLAYSVEERKQLGLRGFFPQVVRSSKDQVKAILTNIHRIHNELDKYVFLLSLLDSNERLFYQVLSQHVEEIMPLVYTPVVGDACIKYSLIYGQPKGMFISLNDRGHIYDILQNWPIDDVRVIVVTDGERILGLGDLGIQGMGIPVGKLALYTALAGVNPKQCLPITLDVGTNNEHLLKDEFYIGLRQKRLTGADYDSFVDEFVQAVIKRFGSTCLIQFEDFGNANAFRILQKYMPAVCCFNDDIQGTASVALAGLLSAVKLTNVPLLENTFLFYGAGEANIGTANLIALAMAEKGISVEEARKKIWLIDSRGLIVKNRPEGGINHEKAPWAKEAPALKELGEIIDHVKPTAIIGAAGQGKVFTEDIIKKVTALNERPIIFALSNPTSKAECTAEEAYHFSEGKAVFASGSPFKCVKYNGQIFHPGQGNNCYIFPAIGLACVACNIKHVTDEFFLVASESLAEQVLPEEFAEGRVYPNLSRIQTVSLKIAIDVAKYALKKNLCHLYPIPDSIEDHIKSQVYNPEY